MEGLQANLRTIGMILIAMTLLALVEAVLPLRARTRWNRAHLGPNLALTFITFATNALFNAALVAALVWVASRGGGALALLGLEGLPATLVTVVALDLAAYVTHVAMHKLPALWRFHRIHHADPAVDVTTTVRQHPVEGLIRYAFLAAFAVPLGASPAAYALYRLLFALSGLLAHANVRLPARLDAVLALLVPWPTAHKVHHSRDARLTDTNYGNILSLWDRLFGTFTPARQGASVDYGLEEFTGAEAQTTAALLALPFRSVSRAGRSSPLRAAP